MQGSFIGQISKLRIPGKSTHNSMQRKNGIENIRKRKDSEENMHSSMPSALKILALFAVNAAATFLALESSGYHEPDRSVPRRFLPFEQSTSPIDSERRFYNDNSVLNRNRSIHGSINEWSAKR